MKLGFVALACTLLLATTTLAAEYKPLTELEGLQIEKVQLEIQLLEERIARLKERVVRFAQDIQRRDGTDGWQIDLRCRRWVRPPDVPKRSEEPC